MAASKLSVNSVSSDHLEFRISHPLEPGSSTEISYYFFIPTALRMKYRWRDRERILENFSVYGRFSSPKFSLKQLLDETVEDNPLWRLVMFLDEDEIDETEFCNTLRLFANSLRNAFGKAVLDWRKIEKEARRPDTSVRPMEYVSDMVRSAKRLQDRWNSLKESFLMGEGCTDGMKSAIAWMDEAWCRESGKAILRISRSMGPFMKTESDRKAAEDIAEFWRIQRKDLMDMSRSAGLSSEDLVYRQHMLKKWYQSILYLKPIMSSARENASQMAAGLAAAFAMAVALSASFLANSMFLSYTVPWIVVTIIAYAFKDRIKEWGRTGLNMLLPKMMSDSVFYFNSPSGKKRLARNKIRVKMTDSSTVPAEIMEARKIDSNPFIDVLPAEDVLQIEHDIETPRHHSEHYGRESELSSGISVISKFSMSDFFRDMDDSESYFFGDFEPGERFAMESGRKPYHVRLIVKVKSGGTGSVDHYLIRLSKNNIESVEKMTRRKHM